MECVAIHTHRRDPKIRTPELLVQLFHRRHFSTTRGAPRSPDVHQHDFPPIIGEGSRLVRAQVRGAESRSARSYLNGVNLRTQPDRERDAEHGGHHDARDQCPLLPVRHAVTMQRRRSSCTSRAGSALANTALPATKVSAPASCAAAIVCLAMPPSTSRKNRASCVVRSVWARRILSF